MGSQFFQIPGLSTLSPPAQQTPAQQPPAQAPTQDQVVSEPGTMESNEKQALDSNNDVAKERAGQEEAPAAMEIESAGTATKKDDSASTAVESPPSPPSLLQSLEAQLGSFAAPVPSSTPSGPQPPTAEQNTVMLDQGNEAQAAPADGVATQGEGDQPEWEEDSSPYESSSDSSSSDDSDDDSDDDGEPLLNPEAMARILMEAESDDDGEGRGKGAGAGGQLRTKNEIPEEVIPKPDVTITPETKMEELGQIEHIVDSIIVVKSSATGEYRALETGSVLCNEDRVVIAAMDNIIGSVREPRYTARFTNEEEIKSFGLSVGSKVFFIPEHSTFVDTGPLKAMKGTDASNWHDEEVAEDEMEFSDDEKEQAYKRELKEKKRARNPNKAGAANGPPGKRGGRGGHHDGSSHTAADPGSLKYDDEEDDDGPYRPLARPAGFGTGAATSAAMPFTHGSGGPHRGGGRGDHRGRGRGRPHDRGGRGGRGYHRGDSGQASRSYGQEPQAPPQQFTNFAAPPPPPQFPQGQYPPTLPQFFGGAGGQQPAAPAPYPFPSWPQNMPQNFIPPPPPQFQQQQQQQPQTQNAPNAAFYNPAFLAALQSQMQGQNPPPNGQWPPQQGGSG